MRNVVLDFGMYDGGFAHTMIERWGCRVYGLEPVPELFESVKPSPRLVMEPKALSHIDSGNVTLYRNRTNTASLVTDLATEGSETITVPTVTLETSMDEHDLASADLAKFDIEGAEVDVFESAEAETLLRLRQLSVEYHDFINPD